MCDEFSLNIENVNSISDLQKKVRELRIISYNNRSKSAVLDLVKEGITTAEKFEDVFSLVNLLSLRITHLQHQKENLQLITEINNQIRSLSLKENYVDGLLLFYAHRWFIEKMKGNKVLASKSIEKCMDLITKSGTNDKFIYNVCSYLYAIELWVEKRNLQSVVILERNFGFFLDNQMYHGLISALGVLIIIYQYSQSKRKSMKLIKQIYSKNLLYDIPTEIRSIFYYFMGVGYKLNLNFVEARNYFEKSLSILKLNFESSIYSSYYLRCLAHITSCYALQGELELSYNKMNEVENQIEERIISRNLDPFSRNQIEHDFNLTKFYILSRLHNVQLNDLGDLIKEIIKKIETQHGDAMFFSEFLLNANLSRKQLIKIKKLNTPSTKRVEHILDFLIAKKNYNKEYQILELVSTLQRRPAEERMTLEERAFADLLAAQEYFKLKRYTEIYPLLRKYEKRLDQIEVLELRLFMEAFIQIGAYKNGDLMGPVNQYLAIKKCRLYRFTKLENRLLDYLDIQAKEARANTNYIYS